MNLRYLSHAQRRMRERNVTEEDVAEVLNGKYVALPGNRPGRMTYEGHCSRGYRLKVVLEPPLSSPAPYTVVTVIRL